MQTNCNSNEINIDDLAQLAREACVYRGRAQGFKPRTRLQALVSIGGRIYKWFTPRKR